MYFPQPGIRLRFVTLIFCFFAYPMLTITATPALCPEIWNVDNGELTHKGKAAVIDELFDSQPGSRALTPSGTPGASTPDVASTPASANTPAGSGDEGGEAGATLDGVAATLAFKAAKGKKKVRFFWIFHIQSIKLISIPLDRCPVNK